MSDYVGIDYSLGRSNVDPETGIHYGVIPLNVLLDWAIEHFEPEYGNPTCPKCGNEATPTGDFVFSIGDEEEYTYAEECCADYTCGQCKYIFDTSEAYPEEPNGWTMEDNEYSLSLDSNNDVWVLKSPYYTYAQFCSPCAPGACHLEHPIGNEIVHCCGVCGIEIEGDYCQNHPEATVDSIITNYGAKTYCLGVKWFENREPPYPIYRVADNSLLFTPTKISDNEETA